MALTFHSTTAFMHALDSGIWLGYVYVGNSTIVVPAAHLERYEWLRPEVSEVVPVEELPPEKQTTHQREHLIFDVGAAMKARKK